MISISLGRGYWIAEAARSYGVKVFAIVTNASHAEKALEGALRGGGCAHSHGPRGNAHGGDVGSAVLIPALVLQFPDSPVVAAGGFVDGDFVNP